MINVRQCAVTTALAVGLVAVPATAQAAGTSSVRPSPVDVAFLRGNVQTDLAEIAIGTIALHRSGDPMVRQLARMTIRDHRLAKAKAKAVAAAVQVSLPARPNAQQRRQAAMLKAVPAAQFNISYLKVQVAGHQASIASTRADLANGTKQRVTGYARFYLPVAKMHLRMAERDLQALGQ